MTVYFYDHDNQERKHEVDIDLLLHENRRLSETQEILRNARSQKLELRCGCTPIPSRLFIRLAFDYLTIVNHKADSHHHKDCPLQKKLINSSQKETDEVVTSYKDDQLLTNGFSLHAKVSESSYQKTPTSGSQSSTRIKSEHRISLLYRHLAQATFNHAYFKNKTQSEKKVLYDLKNGCKEIPFGKTYLNKWVFYGDNAYKRACAALSSVSDDNWLGAGRPHALLFFISKEVLIENELVSLDGNYFQVSKIIKTGNIQACCFVALSLVHCPSTKKIICHTALIQPILSASLALPIQNFFEKELLTSLQAIIDLKTGKGLRWSFFKPFPNDKQCEVNGYHLPNLIVQAKNSSGEIMHRRLIYIHTKKSSGIVETSKLVKALADFKAADVLRVMQCRAGEINRAHLSIAKLVEDIELKFINQLEAR